MFCNMMDPLNRFSEIDWKLIFYYWVASFFFTSSVKLKTMKSTANYILIQSNDLKLIKHVFF